MNNSGKLDLILKELAEVKSCLLKLYPIYVTWKERAEHDHELLRSFPAFPPDEGELEHFIKKRLISARTESKGTITIK